jgi:hypothetical protein
MIKAQIPVRKIIRKIPDWCLPFFILTVGFLLKLLTGIWAFTMLTVGVLLISLTGIWHFTLLTVGVLLKSLNGVWPSIRADTSQEFEQKTNSQYK